MRRSFTEPTVADLVGQGLSKSYAFELVKGDKTPSLRVAVELEKALRIPPRWWVERAA